MLGSEVMLERSQPTSCLFCFQWNNVVPPSYTLSYLLLVSRARIANMKTMYQAGAG